MAQISRGGLRRLWFQVHLWVGVALALVLIPLSASGSYLVWKAEVDRATHPARFAVTSDRAQLAPSAYLAAARTAFGDRADPSQLRMPEKPGDPVIVTGQIRAAPGERPLARPRTLTAWVDPGAGKVLEVADPRQGFSMWMHDLHGQLFVPPMGRKIVGWLGWLMLGSCLTGLWLWWPKNGDLSKAFRWKRTPSTLLNLHYLTGFWVALPLAFLSFSGAVISFPQFARSVVGPFAEVTPQQARGGPPGGGAGKLAARTALGVDQAAGYALESAPRAVLVSVALPTQSREGVGEWRVQVKRPGEAAPAVISVDDATGVAKPQRARPPLGGEEILRVNRRLHDGIGMALAWKLVITVTGLIPALLGVTGVIVWARRQLRKSAVRRRLAEPVAQPAE